MNAAWNNYAQQHLAWRSEDASGRAGWVVARLGRRARRSADAEKRKNRKLKRRSERREKERRKERRRGQDGIERALAVAAVNAPTTRRHEEKVSKAGSEVGHDFDRSQGPYSRGTVFRGASTVYQLRPCRWDQVRYVIYASFASHRPIATRNDA